MIHDLLFRLRSLFRRPAMDAELGDELTFHLERETEKLVRSAVPPVEAARRARLAFGFPEQVKQDCREARGTRWVEQFAQDVAFSVRMLRLNPTFAVVATLSLAIGIGANTAIFQLVDAVRLRNLPVLKPEELQRVHIAENKATGNFSSRYSDLSYAQWEQIRNRQQAFRSIAPWSARNFNLAGGGEVQPAEGILVGGAFFETLGVRAWRGRLIDQNDDKPGCGSPVAVVSYSFWQRNLGGSSSAIGRNLSVDGHAFTIAGITPPSFFGVEVGRSYDVAIPLCAEDTLAGADNQLTAYRDNYWLGVIGRLREGWTPQQASAQMAVISPGVFSASVPQGKDAGFVKRYESMRLEALPAGKGFSWLRLRYEDALVLLLASAALVLLIACGNLANLLLARANARAHEISVRTALGASGGRLLRQLLTESLLLASLGASFGVALAGAASRWLVSFLVTADDPVALDTGLDWRVLSFSLAVALITSMLFGLLPALRAVRSGGSGTPLAVRNSTATRDRSLARRVLVVVQIALSLVLLAGALLFGRSLFNLLNGDMGFRAEHVLITSLDSRRLRFDKDRQVVLFAEALDRLRAIPGVTNAAQTVVVPMSGWSSGAELTLNSGEHFSAKFTRVTSEYFKTLETPILAGREFTAQEMTPSAPVVIVNQAMAHRIKPDGRVLGETLRSPFDEKQKVTIVGIVKNTKYGDLRESFEPLMFCPAPQLTNYARYLVRSPLPRADLTRRIRDAIAGLSPVIDIEFAGLDTEIRESIARERLIAALAAGFGIVAALLAAVGLYGMLAWSVASRRNEIGIRMALGADRGNVLGMVLSEAALLLGIGVLAGVGMALAAGRATASLLYGVQPRDPLTLAAAAVALIAVGLLSSYLPARQASRLDPLSALRRD